MAGLTAELCRSWREKGIEVLGPAPAPIDRIRDRYRWQVLLKGSDSSQLHAACGQVLENQSSLARGDTRIAVDVDPESMM